jgi:hypothetical protein
MKKNSPDRKSLELKDVPVLNEMRLELEKAAPSAFPRFSLISRCTSTKREAST